MANQSGIEWLQNPDGSKGLTVNPVIGCSRISPGCGGGCHSGPAGERGGCWAEELVSSRLSRNPLLPIYRDLAREGGGWSGIVKCLPERLADIVRLGRREKGSRVFVCDLSDLFHDDVPFEFIAAVFGAMACAPQSLFYVLTKRPARALEFATWLDSKGTERLAQWIEEVAEGERKSGVAVGSRGAHKHHGQAIVAHDHVETYDPRAPFRPQFWPLPNVAFGVTVEDRRYGVPRLELARCFPARYRFVSAEPLLEDLGPDVDFTGFDLVIAGGEAHKNARPHDLQWSRNVLAAAHRAGAARFFKQAGDYVLDSSTIEHKTLRMRRFGPKGSNFDALPVELQVRENLPMPEGT